MKFLRAFLVLFAVILLSACGASGPKHTEVASAIPNLKATDGRIYFYRSNNYVGGGVRPSIYLNEEIVGDSKPGGFFFVDKAAGSVSVSTSTEVEKKLTFSLEAGQTRYVKTSAGFGLFIARIYPELVDDATGAKEIAETSYTGRSAATSK
jgi:hypothetical protein